MTRVARVLKSSGNGHNSPVHQKVNILTEITEKNSKKTMGIVIVSIFI